MIEEAQLSNGIQIIHEVNPFSNVGHLGVFINVGTRDEGEEELGIAHFLEHVIFKGTKKRKAFHVLSRLDAVGGEINAYTTKEETCVYASFTDQYLSRASDLLSDIIFNSNFPAAELKREKEVVVDEINSYKDSPSELIFDEFEQLIFGNHPLGRDILGTEESVRALRRKDVINFVKTHYVPENMVISSVGNYSLKKLLKVLEKHFGERQAVKGQINRRAPGLIKPQQKMEEKDVYQAHVMLGGRAYKSTHENRTALLMLNNVLGGAAMNSRLNLSVRERHGFTYNIESNYVPFSDSGSFSVYFGTDLKNIEKTEKLVLKELKKLCDTKLGVNQLHQAKQQIKGQVALGLESKVGLMLSLGKSKLLYGKVDPIEEVLKKFDEIEADLLQDVANEIMHPNRLFKLTYKPK